MAIKSLRATKSGKGAVMACAHHGAVGQLQLGQHAFHTAVEGCSWCGDGQGCCRQLAGTQSRPASTTLGAQSCAVMPTKCSWNSNSLATDSAPVDRMPTARSMSCASSADAHAWHQQYVGNLAARRLLSAGPGANARRNIISPRSDSDSRQCIELLAGSNRSGRGDGGLWRRQLRNEAWHDALEPCVWGVNRAANTQTARHRNSCASVSAHCWLLAATAIAGALPASRIPAGTPRRYPQQVEVELAKVVRLGHG